MDLSTPADTIIPTSALDSGPAVVRHTGHGRFVVLAGPDKGDGYILSGAAIVVGSGRDCDISLSDKTVSRQHLAVEPKSNGVHVRDLGSKNGSFVHGARFKELLLGYGAEVTLGKTTLKFVPQEEVVDPAPAVKDRFGHMLGRDPRVRALFTVLEEVAPHDATVLLHGETGTGKEMLAEELHAHSHRNRAPFVVFDCAAVPRDLIASALFGHVRGAFTGAVAERRGAFLEAEGGTLFLDEIGELSQELQPTLLRVLDRKMIQPVGGSSYRKVDVRIVAATNRDLREEVRAGRFREDLYYRLAVVKLTVPPLRERPDDIRLLANHFAQTFCRSTLTRFSEGDLRKLEQHPWPGNVRELRNVVERACLRAREGNPTLSDNLELEAPAEPHGAFARYVSPGTSEPGTEGGMAYRDAKAHVLEHFEYAFLRDLLRAHGSNLSAAARAAQMDRKQLRTLLKRYGLIS